MFVFELSLLLIPLFNLNDLNFAKIKLETETSKSWQPDFKVFKLRKMKVLNLNCEGFEVLKIQIENLFVMTPAAVQVRYLSNLQAWRVLSSMPESQNPSGHVQLGRYWYGTLVGTLVPYLGPVKFVHRVTGLEVGTCRLHLQLSYGSLWLSEGIVSNSNFKIRDYYRSTSTPRRYVNITSRRMMPGTIHCDMLQDIIKAWHIQTEHESCWIARRFGRRLSRLRGYSLTLKLKFAAKTFKFESVATSNSF